MRAVRETAPVEITESIDVPHDPEVVFAVVQDLAGYPAWIDIVTRVVVDDNSDDDAWIVDLRGRVGPLARSKRLRMVRTTFDAPNSVGFQRRELDGRSHSDWTLSASVTDLGDSSSGTRLTMRLGYSGGLWGPVLERLLGDVVTSSRSRLLTCLDAVDS